MRGRKRNAAGVRVFARAEFIATRLITPQEVQANQACSWKDRSKNRRSTALPRATKPNEITLHPAALGSTVPA